jgi:hypothetical protein
MSRCRVAHVVAARVHGHRAARHGEPGRFECARCCGDLEGGPVDTGARLVIVATA